MKSALLHQLHNLPYFTKNTLRSLCDESANTLDVSIKRMLDSGKLIKLKNGVYTSQHYFNRNGQSQEYREFLASVLCQPSYLSMEYVLGKHDILTESVLTFTGVSLKTTRSYENKFGSFIYKTIKSSLYTGYTTKFFGNNTYYIATKAKALFDYLYFLSDRVDLRDKNYDIIEEQRLKIELFEKSDWKELFGYFEIEKK